MQVLNLGSNVRGLETTEFRNFNSQNLAAQNCAKFNRRYFLSIESSLRRNQDASRPHLSYLELRKPRVRVDLTAATFEKLLIKAYKARTGIYLFCLYFQAGQTRLARSIYIARKIPNIIV